MGKISALIVDDEPLARERLRGMLGLEPEVEIIGECENGADAIVAIRHALPDVVFLDMQMPGCDGLEVIARLPAGRRPAIVFATAHERFALDAFNVAAVDYLLKPFDRERLHVALGRVQEHLRIRTDGKGFAGKPAPVSPIPKNERLAVKTDGRIVFLRADEIVWVEADDNYVVLHLQAGRLMVRETLAAIEVRLGPDSFARVNRSALVHLDQIKELQPALHGDYTVMLRDGTKLPLSRSLRPQLERFAPGLT